MAEFAGRNLFSSQTEFVKTFPSFIPVQIANVALVFVGYVCRACVSVCVRVCEANCFQAILENANCFVRNCLIYGYRVCSTARRKGHSTNVCKSVCRRNWDDKVSKKKNSSEPN